MLREVAEALQGLFGQEHTYRVGGDEYVAFMMDGQLESLHADMEQLGRALSEKGYHISFGISTHDMTQGEPNMNQIVSEAESKMFAAKREFYRKRENDRRSR